MSREIKFRALDKNRKIMIYDSKQYNQKYITVPHALNYVQRAFQGYAV
jgi:hypothetical protein